jgi:hypothetical protein
MPSVGSPRMVDIVGEMPGKPGSGPIRVPISREFREWLLAMWRRTGGDGDMVDEVTTTANSTAAALAGLSARVASLQGQIADNESDTIEYQLLPLVASLQSPVAELESAPAGAATWTEAEIDFGTTGVYDATFTIVDASVSLTSEVAVVQSGVAATSRGAGDALWDAITYAAVPAAGSFTLYALAHPGPVVGMRKILYQVGS